MLSCTAVLQIWLSVPLGTVTCWVDKETEHIKRQKIMSNRGFQAKNSVCAFVRWSKQAHYHSCLSFQPMHEWPPALNKVVLSPPPTPPRPLCIYHVVYSKVIFSMRVTAPLQIIEHLMRVIIHRAAGSFHSTFPKPFPLRSTFRWAVLKALPLFLLNHQWWNHSLMQCL